jgi:CHAT domain-containing protein
VPSAQLAEYLRTIDGLQLVVLNSCWSGALTRRRGQDPFSGVGAALIKSGVPAVVAMQFPVSDNAAVAFSRAFYERLAARDCIADHVAGGARTRPSRADRRPSSFPAG